MRQIPLRAAASLLVNALIWGTSWTAFRFLQTHGIHPLWSTAIIFSVCAILLIAFRPDALRQMRGHSELLLVALTAGLTNACFNGAVAFGDVVRVSLLFYLMPVWAVFLARIVLREAITARSLSRIALGLGGAMIVLYQPEAGLPLPRGLSDWAAILGGFTFAWNNVMLRRLKNVPDLSRDCDAAWRRGIVGPAWRFVRRVRHDAMVDCVEYDGDADAGGVVHLVSCRGGLPAIRGFAVAGQYQLADHADRDPGRDGIGLGAGGDRDRCAGTDRRRAEYFRAVADRG